MKLETFCNWLEENQTPMKLKSSSILVMDNQRTLMWKSTRKPILMYCELFVTAWNEF